MKNILFKIRIILWRILGVDYVTFLRKNDYTLLKSDKYTIKRKGTYDNGAKVWRWTDAQLTIGKYCSIANNVNFIMDEGGHTISKVTNFPLAVNLFKNDRNIGGIEKKIFFDKFNQKTGIEIGNDVWIGMGVYIMPGVKIGNGVTIAANAVVTKNIPDYALVAGVPAKIISMKHEDKVIKKLNEIAWWNWDEDIIKERILDFYDLNDFIKKWYTNSNKQ